MQIIETYTVFKPLKWDIITVVKKNTCSSLSSIAPIEKCIGIKVLFLFWPFESCNVYWIH